MFAADGTPEGSEFLVNSTVPSDQYWPLITTLAGGGFVVPWESYEDGDFRYENVNIRGRVCRWRGGGRRG